MVWNFDWPFTPENELRTALNVGVSVSVSVDVSFSVSVDVSVSVGVKLILTKKTIFLAFKHAFGPWSETLNGRLPPKTSSYSAQTSAKRVSEHSRHFIFWRKKFFFAKKKLKIFSFSLFLVSFRKTTVKRTSPYKSLRKTIRIHFFLRLYDEKRSWSRYILSW